MHYDLVKNKEKGGKIALMSAITRGNGFNPTDRTSSSVHLGRLNKFACLYVCNRGCSKCGQTE